MTYKITHDLYLQSTPEQIIEGVSNPTHLNNWWTNDCSGDQTVDAIYTFYFTPKFTWKARLVEYDPQNTVIFKMIKADDDWNPTSFGFIIKKVNHGSLLSFYHDGWNSNNQHFRITSFCWAILLGNLKDYLDKGIIIPFSERDKSGI